MRTGDPFDLGRFLAAQEGVHERALAELRAGRKTSHWMWFVFPQLAGLGHSEMSSRYAIRSLAEARAYLRHPLLGERLSACVEALCAHARADPPRSAQDVLGAVDALKLRSSMTLFARASGDGDAATAFARVLHELYGGVPDEATERLLAAAQSPPAPGVTR